ncbi:MAG: Na+/H+ antiporter subunit E [Hyphomicrobiaceae bacterium]|nr:Na+/H+ antiporter subunit E [Hyphomicrobiaceae bacterium]MCC0008826.1 Na+/H+ antiporter subunit E [Hyphomicrobiaceae bacterium]
MMRAFSLAVSLFAFWLALSGHYTLFLTSLGALAAIVVVWMSLRMGVVDAEGHPIQHLWPALTYYPWLLVEIVKSAWSVSKIIINPSLPISPTMTVVRASQRSNIGLTTYANSITLTPGTITVSVRGDEFTVHALTREGADDVEAGGMDRRVRQFEEGA